MWDRKRPEAAPVNPAAVAPVPQPAAPPTIARPAPSGGTLIGRSMRVVGDIYCEEDLYIDGEVDGAVEVSGSKVTVGPNGKAKSNIKAEEVIILGKVQGDIDASSKITIRKDGSLVGNIRTSGIVIDDDAYFKGSIDIVKKAAAASA